MAQEVKKVYNLTRIADEARIWLGEFSLPRSFIPGPKSQGFGLISYKLWAWGGLTNIVGIEDIGQPALS